MFANELHKLTDGNLKYVIVQKTRKVTLFEKFQKLLKTVGWKNLWREFYCVLYIRLNKKYRRYLKYFFQWSKIEPMCDFLSEVKEVDDVNSQEVYEMLQKIKPKLLVVWGSNILEPRIFNSAQNAINLHMGLGEHYRGAVANHYAILENKRETIGAMIHKIDEKTDSGDIYSTVKADLNLPPRELFIKLNDEAFKEFLNISNSLWLGKDLPTRPQNLNASKNILLRQWTPSRRLVVAEKIKEWENASS